MSRGRAPPAPKFFGAHREGPAVASAILESGGTGDRSVLLFRILPKPGCWHRQVIVSTGVCAPRRNTCRSFNEGNTAMADTDRKSVEEGQSGSVRVDVEGRPVIKKKKKAKK